MFLIHSNDENLEIKMWKLRLKLWLLKLSLTKLEEFNLFKCKTIVNFDIYNISTALSNKYSLEHKIYFKTRTKK